MSPCSIGRLRAAPLVLPLLFGLLLPLARPAGAQPYRPPTEDLDPGRSLTLTLPTTTVLFRTPFLEGETEVGLEDAAGIGVRFAGQTAALTLTQASEDQGETGSTEALTAELLFGPTYTPISVDVMPGAAVQLRVPVRFDFGYAMLHRELIDGSPFPIDETYHLLRAGLGLGLGLGGIFETTSDLVPYLSGNVHVVIAPGILTEVGENAFDPVFAQRTSEFDLELRTEQLGNSNFGIAVGYTLYRAVWDPAGLDGAADVLDAIRADGFPEQSRIGMVRFGLVF